MRSDAREAAFKIIFASLFHEGGDPLSRSAILKQAKLKEEENAFALSLVSAVEEHRAELSARLSEHLKGYMEYRLYTADRAILLLALAEILYFDDIPPVVSVSEAADLARKYSSERSPDFVNGVLGGIINQ